MLRCLEVRIQDPSFLLLIRMFLKAGYVDASQFVLPEQGTAQGGNLSPIISNIFLHYVLDLWLEKKVKPQIHGDCHLVRYADDYLCLVQRQQDAQSIEQAMRERFTKFDLELHPEKTRVIHFGRNDRTRADSLKQGGHTFDFLGFTHYCGQSRRGYTMLYRKTSSKRFRRACKELAAWLKTVRSSAKVQEWWPILQAKLRGHYQYYGISGNGRSLAQYADLADQLVFNRKRGETGNTNPAYMKVL